MLDRLQGKMFSGLMRSDLRGLRALARRTEISNRWTCFSAWLRVGSLSTAGAPGRVFTIKGYFALLLRRLAGR